MTKSVLFAVVAFVAVVSCVTGCDKKEEGGAAGTGSAATTTSSATPAAKAAAAANDPIVCCKFGGVKGSSTKKTCETGKGEVVPDSECPTLKK